MAIDNKFERVEEDSPERCQAIVKHGQCPYKKSPQCEFCPMHVGRSYTKRIMESTTRTYRLAKWQARVNEFSEHECVKSLREEIGILRVVLEETMNVCQTSGELLLYSNKIASLVRDVDKVVNSCHRLEAATGLLLDKGAALQIATTIVEIIATHVSDENLLDTIGNQIIELILKTEAIT